jgi:hypothetical protein
MTLQLSRRTSAEGYWYRLGERELGPFSVQDERKPDFEKGLAEQLNVTVEELQKAKQNDINRPVSLSEVAQTLGTTIRHDDATKLIVFLGCINTFTDQDQVNILMAGEASGGKSYIALEVASYFQ